MVNADIFFPKTNPIVFFKDDEYLPCKDAALREKIPCFIQQFNENDIIAFQFRLENFSPVTTVNLLITLNDKETLLYDKLSLYLNGGSSGSTPNFICFSNNIVINFQLFLKRTIIFSQSIYEINENIYGQTNKFINDGDRFYFTLQIISSNGEEAEIKSNELICKHDNTDTKLIHYDYSDKDYLAYSTNFQLMPNGYDIRLQCEFLPVTQKANKETFQNYDGAFALVSATPYETVKLLIGDKNGIGVPDWLIRNLNYILHLDQKTIDGVPYELTESAELEVDIYPGYNHRFLQIELAKKSPEDWISI